jgi:hypothetical protein
LIFSSGTFATTLCRFGDGHELASASVKDDAVTVTVHLSLLLDKWVKGLGVVN